MGHISPAIESFLHREGKPPVYIPFLRAFNHRSGKT